MVTNAAAVEGKAAARMRGVRKAAGSALAVVRSDGPAGQVVRFVWHFVQMAVVMLLGMLPLGFILAALGQSNLSARSPETYALAMMASMVIPMAAFMRIRGHSWERTAEMSGAMTVPSAVLLAASLLGLIPQKAALSITAGGMGIPMWAGMLGAMFFRWRDYAQHHHNHLTRSSHADYLGPETIAPGQSSSDK